MDNGMENMLDTYLFETKLSSDAIGWTLINAEKSKDFTADNVNEEFSELCIQSKVPPP